MNLYTYVKNNPIKYADPSGHEDIQSGIGAGSLGAGASIDGKALGDLIIRFGAGLFGVGTYAENKQKDVPVLNKSKDEEDKSESNVPENILKPGSKEWKEAVKQIKEGRGKGHNFRVKSKEDAEKLLKEGRPKLEEKETYTDEVYKDGYEHHPAEPDVGNDLPHIKWKDWSKGKSSGADGHIFYP